MSNFMTTYFGPLDKQYCVYYLFLAMLFFAALIFAIFGELIYVIKKYKEINFRTFSNGILLLFNIFVAYFVNRLLYTMCTKSLA